MKPVLEGPSPSVFSDANKSCASPPPPPFSTYEWWKTVACTNPPALLPPALLQVDATPWHLKKARTEGFICGRSPRKRRRLKYALEMGRISNRRRRWQHRLWTAESDAEKGECSPP